MDVGNGQPPWLGNSHRPVNWPDKVEKPPRITDDPFLWSLSLTLITLRM